MGMGQHPLVLSLLRQAVVLQMELDGQATALVESPIYFQESRGLAISLPKRSYVSAGFVHWGTEGTKLRRRVLWLQQLKTVCMGIRLLLFIRRVLLHDSQCGSTRPKTSTPGLSGSS
jgi:hypothetical protein